MAAERKLADLHQLCPLDAQHHDFAVDEAAGIEEPAIGAEGQSLGGRTDFHFRDLLHLLALDAQQHDLRLIVMKEGVAGLIVPFARRTAA